MRAAYENRDRHLPSGLRAWLEEAAGITEGAVFRAIDRHGRIAARLSDRAIALIVKRRAAAAGLDPTAHSAHSLRVGCATEAAARGVEERDIGRHTHHRSIAVLRGYIRKAARLGLRQRATPSRPATARSQCCAAICAPARSS